MGKNLVAKASTTIDAPNDEVWSALVTPDAIREYMFGAEVSSDWHEGSSIRWKGKWKGRDYEDKGKILAFRPGQTLQYTHYSPLSGEPDAPESYHTVTIELSDGGAPTKVSLTQDNNPSEEAREHSEKNWGMMLALLKHFVEKQGSRSTAAEMRETHGRHG
jgi:uncharacterized protein YndB with AHSA1/START domain